ncbi:leucine efflux protein LeuE, partial [Desulfovibrio sp. OttesenSCG-928-M14]|nr:leucine efflux protein LeuE [Desulfovibrio sp. OttesenSCG-928-M14]
MLENFGVIHAGTFVLGVVGIMIAPGPASLFVLSTASRFGRGAGVRAMSGIFLGDAILMTLASAGAASAVALNPALFSIIVYIGATYLSFLGLRVLFSQIRPRRAAANKAAPAVEGHFFFKALLVSLSNPNTILFYLSFFVQFVAPSHAGRILPFVVLAC